MNGERDRGGGGQEGEGQRFGENRHDFFSNIFFFCKHSSRIVELIVNQILHNQLIKLSDK